MNALLGGWTVSTSLYYNSGFPLHVGSSNWYPGWDGAIYANLNPGAQPQPAIQHEEIRPDEQCRAGQSLLRPGGLLKSTHRRFWGTRQCISATSGDSEDAYENVMVMKYFTFAERFKLQFRFEFYNLFNRHDLQDPSTNIAGSDFGHVTSTTGSPREGQIGARFEW